MLLIKAAFMLVFIVGTYFIISPVLESLAVGVVLLRRNRFYQKRRKNGRGVEDEKKGYKHPPLFKKMDEYLSIAEVRISTNHLLGICLVIFVAFFLLCYQIMPNVPYDLIIALLFSTVPLLWCWSKYQKKTLAMASVMIPTVQNFIGYFTESDNLEGAIYKSARTVPFEIASEWNRLIMDLQTGDRPEAALIQFADRVGNDWAQYFVDILITHVDTGVDITSSLFKLINEMQNTMYNEEKRITLLTAYKWGTVIMVALSAFAVYFNIRMDPENYKYYFHDPTGVRVVTLSIFVLFISFVAAINMGKKRV
ncbi:type II secretion system F family protein [Paenibacillus sp. D51F]